MKKGFTLIELLAVIIILAVIALIATPIVLNVIDSAKRSANEASIRGYGDAIKLAVYEHQFASNGAIPEIDKEWALNNVKKGGNDVTCSEIKYNTSGVIMKDCTVKDDDKSYCFASGKLYDDCSSKEFLDAYNASGSTKPGKACTFEGEITNDKEFTYGQYTYKYKNYSTGNAWASMGEDGWGVVLTNKASTDPVTTELCTTINGKPVTRMDFMFYDSKAAEIDLSSFDTSHVTSMQSMFYKSQATGLDLSSFDTSNVTNMIAMFHTSKVTDLDLSGFNTSNVIDMRNMFNNSQITSLDLSKFDTSSVTDMTGMFSNTKMLTLDLSNFNTSNVINMTNMFAGNSLLTEIKFGEKFDTSNVVSMYGMFSGITAMTILDLSTFNTLNVSDMDYMFVNSRITTGYARTGADADKLNASSNKPSNLTFVVKTN